jgi:hypothetical protein
VTYVPACLGLVGTSALASNIPSRRGGRGLSSDAAVRENALSFIYFKLSNKATAPTWRVGFDPEVRGHVLKLSASPLPAERERP